MDDVIKLIGETITERDEYGNPVTSKTEREVMCRMSGISRDEFYAAAVAGMHPEWTVRLSDFRDYQGERLAEYNGQTYEVIRTYRDPGSMHQGSGMAPNEIELVLQKKVGLN